MNHNQKFEITDLVNEAVSNAAVRRNQVLDSEEGLSSLSDEQAGSVTGGAIFNIKDIIIFGGFPFGLNRQINP
ncbi:hypothetical protein NIES2119_00660 [[Phormidium ambiguum] IAM M-71]|uniref:Uncharacterized protein n=1 Tax=[Phormidium ambiguum] IAM M-71 TaxID=454136 RepID=A0A1U7ITT6_9CYAN|nr:hypothetical protein [Phormidium ambiguum]OKH40858.1 hypothetical protein NIES2119_00660 [Phormidium ambiguum IAM M-71]